MDECKTDLTHNGVHANRFKSKKPQIISRYIDQTCKHVHSSRDEQYTTRVETRAMDKCIREHSEWMKNIYGVVVVLGWVGFF